MSGVVLFSILVAMAINYFIGTLIDKRTGGLWGLFLGPIGWIIAAILKGKESPQRVVAEKDDLDDADFARWNLLKTVDDEIAEAAARVAAHAKAHRFSAEEIEREIAKTYMALNDKVYLYSIVDKALARPREGKKEQIEIRTRTGKILQLQLSETGVYSGPTLMGTTKEFKTEAEARAYYS